MDMTTDLTSRLAHYAGCADAIGARRGRGTCPCFPDTPRRHFPHTPCRSGARARGTAGHALGLPVAGEAVQAR